jgi:NAD(P)-dependent dehydrogenase (short-subunit alcohol dehydrogenase family)
MTADFTGKTALITGAGRGTGGAVAFGLADAGAGLILLARSEDQLAETRAMVLARGAAADRVRVIPADLGDEERRDAAAVAAVGTARADILVNNAATVEPIGPTAAERFSKNFAQGNLLTPGQSAAALIAHLSGDDTGAIWDVSTAPVAS